ncbi:PAS domain-containing protein [Halarsenatibacter silvermanii]|uniref:PAS domain-containing protein n=1 Tax=Halarsenatibacter silvermanii TaxID=321763 RepID=A0A1G9TAP4_9FIRM|nr:PAS domain-containing protein [Halarsenatibacter silvermanii]
MQPDKVSAGNKYPKILRQAGCSEEVLAEIENNIADVMEKEQQFRCELSLETGEKENRYELRMNKCRDGILALKRNITARKEKEGKIKEKNRFLEGEISEVVEFGRDITEHQKAQKELKKAKDEQQLLLDNIDVQVWLLEDERTYRRVNDAFAEFVGLDKKEILNSDVREVRKARENKQSCLQGNKEVFVSKERRDSLKFSRGRTRAADHQNTDTRRLRRGRIRDLHRQRRDRVKENTGEAQNKRGAVPGNIRNCPGGHYTSRQRRQNNRGE